MIPPHIISQILETARIEEVIGEFVHLKKAGSNFKGLSPFNDEKTPSFMVSPAKQIFKDFSSGKGGNVVSFVMEHEAASYPEALRWLAKKYNIEIPEVEQTDEQKEAYNERESLLIALKYAENYFVDQMNDTDEGKSVGLGYFKERGFSSNTIEKFRLGFSPSDRKSFYKNAKENGYSKEILEKGGLIKQRNDSFYDAFSGRVIFPIHNLSGKTIGFGARTLSADKKIPKYLNSPETAVYHKSQILYGIYQAKSDIIKYDKCYLVEGYTDVLSMYQSGVTNTVASSGTALTKEQIRLIKRYTENVTILYDGDNAGIKASFRGIDLILEQGLNVRVVSFPDGEDPDSYASKLSDDDFKSFLKESEKDFISFKTSVLLDGVGNDPVKKAGLLKDILASIALIPDAITRTVYVKECSNLLGMNEEILLQELRKARKKNYQENSRKSSRTEAHIAPDQEVYGPYSKAEQPKKEILTTEFQERDLIRLMVRYHSEMIVIEDETDKGEVEEYELPLAHYIIEELNEDNIQFDNPDYRILFNEFVSLISEEKELTDNHFIHHPDQKIQQLFIDFVTEKYRLDNWEGVKIIVRKEKDILLKAVDGCLINLRSKHIEKMVKRNEEKLKLALENNAEIDSILEEKKRIDEVRKSISKNLGIVIR